jgi:hypothetical protein
MSTTPSSGNDLTISSTVLGAKTRLSSASIDRPLSNFNTTPILETDIECIWHYESLRTLRRGTWVRADGKVADEIESGIKGLERRKKELEDEYESLENRFKQRTISPEDYSKEKKRLEREFIEIMDRLTQYRFQRSGFSG